MSTDIHRLLDEAFAGVEMTPDAQDLKEEIRANLLARAEELEASGTAPADAARRAVAELGDVRELLGEAVPTPLQTPLARRPEPPSASAQRVIVAARRSTFPSASGRAPRPGSSCAPWCGRSRPSSAS